MPGFLKSLFPNLNTYFDTFISNIFATLEMFFISGIISFILGLLFGILLIVFKKDGIKENKIVYQILSVIISVFRSIPFIILLIFLIPFTRAIVGTAIGVKGAIIPLIFGTVPFFSRQIETALDNVSPGKLEAAKSMGSSSIGLIFRVYLKESLPEIIKVTTITAISLVGLTAMAGAVGAGGIGDFAINYGQGLGYMDIVYACVIFLLLFICLIQALGTFLARKTTNRKLFSLNNFELNRKSITVLSVIGALASVFVILGITLPKKTTSKPLVITIPNDSTNLSRGLKLLEQEGFIELDPNAGYSPEMKDITRYVYNIEIRPIAANTLTPTFNEVGASTINSTFASAAGMKPSRDGLASEKPSSDNNPYVNIVCCREGEGNNLDFLQIKTAYQTDLVSQYIWGKYEEANAPVFGNYLTKTSDEISSTVKLIDEYESLSVGKKKIKVGVVGASNFVWKAVQYELDKAQSNIYIELVELNAYNLPNEALNSKDIDLNAFQHKAFLNKEISQNNYKIEVLFDTLIAPLTLYSASYKTVDELKEAAGLR